MNFDIYVNDIGNITTFKVKSTRGYKKEVDDIQQIDGNIWGIKENDDVYLFYCGKKYKNMTFYFGCEGILNDDILKSDFDLILVGGPVSNNITNKVMDKLKIKVDNNNPGKNRGVIQKQIINGHLVILLAGSDRWGTKAAVEYFKQLDDIPEEPIFVEWRDGKAVKIEKP